MGLEVREDRWNLDSSKRACEEEVDVPGGTILGQGRHLVLEKLLQM